MGQVADTSRKALQLELNWMPCSKKNNMEVKRRGSKVWPGPNARVEQEERRIAASAKAAIAAGCKMLKDYDKALTKAKIPKEHDVGMRVTLIVGKKPEGDGCRIEIEDLGIPPKRRRTGRIRDAINVPAIIADALQGVCYEDDEQVVELRVRVEHE